MELVAAEVEEMNWMEMDAHQHEWNGISNEEVIYGAHEDEKEEGEIEVDEAMEEEEDSEDDPRGRPIFPIYGAPNFNCKPEDLTAEEYIRRVRHECSSLSFRKKQAKLDLVTSGISPPHNVSNHGNDVAEEITSSLAKLPKFQIIPKSPSFVLPEKAWTTTFVAQCNQFRKRLFTSPPQSNFLNPHVNTGDMIFSNPLRASASESGSNSFWETEPTNNHKSTDQNHAGQDKWIDCCSVDYHSLKSIRTKSPTSLYSVQANERIPLSIFNYLTTIVAPEAESEDARAVSIQRFPSLIGLEKMKQPLIRRALTSLIVYLASIVDCVSRAENQVAKSEKSVTLSPSESITACLLNNSYWLHVPGESHTRWLYALLLHLQKPYPADIDSQLLALFRTVSTIRGTLGNLWLKSHGDNTPLYSSTLLSHCHNCYHIFPDRIMYCNLLLTLLEHLFAQSIPK